MSTTPVVPEAPQDLFAASVSDKSTTLIWDAAQIMGVGSIKEYQVYSDGKLVATTVDTHLKLNDLSPSTNYNFSVVAVDEAGSSKPSASISLMTKAEGTAALDQVFSPYIDMSLSNSQHLVDIVKDAHLTDITLAFVLNSGQNQIGWGGSGSITNDVLPNGSTMLSQIQAVQSMGGNVTISFGGANGVEPALAFTNAKDLTTAYQSVIDRYHVNSIDFDIEGGAIANTNANHLRNVAIAELEKSNPDLKVSFTLPVMPDGLTYNGIDLLKQAKADGVKIDVVNIMAMDYGSGADSGDMGKDAINAAVSTIQQLKSIGLDAKVGITPMIGINDVQSEVFTLQDAQELMAYAKDNPDIGSIGMWSIGRDNGHEVNVVSPVSSGISQSDYAFSSVFGLL
jgi:chitinase